MPKFSVIIPVYNTEKYLERCLESVLNQNFKNYEIIIINDGSTDGSKKIIEKYLKKHKNIIYIENKSNKGLSNARNNGVLESNGEYLLFLDSDDYYNEGFLKKLNVNIKDNVDVIKYKIRDVFEDKKIIEYGDPLFTVTDGVSAFKYLSKSHYIEVACTYCYKKSFWKKNQFKFAENTFHEDFGLIPLVILKAKSIKCLDYIGYNYFQRAGSIMNSDDYEKTKKKALDFLEHFKFLKKESSKISADLAIFNSYIANSLIIKATTLKGEDYRKYIKEIRENNAFEMLLEDTFLRKIKKILISIDPKIYYKIVRR